MAEETIKALQAEVARWTRDVNAKGMGHCPKLAVPLPKFNGTGDLDDWIAKVHEIAKLSSVEMKEMATFAHLTALEGPALSCIEAGREEALESWAAFIELLKRRFTN